MRPFFSSGIKSNASQRKCHLSRRGRFNFSRWRGRRLRCITASNGRMDEKGETRIKRALSMGPWFSAPRDLYFCTRSHVTLIHLPLRMYRFVYALVRIYPMNVSYVRTCTRIYVCARTYIYRGECSSTLSEELRRAPWFQNILPFLVEFLIFRVLSAPFLPSGRLLPQSAIFCTARTRGVLSSRDSLFPVGRDNALPMCIKFAYNFKKTGMRFSLRWHMIVCLLINTHVMRYE